ncbi:MAG TPA: hypothetical protein DD640_01365 [Clostridiales bacterium]|nr:hypothetical protein [Clostridiales bacterium]
MTSGVWSLYGPEKVTAMTTKEKVAALPVFGIKNGGSAMLAAATQGSEDSSITVMPGGYIMDLDRTYYTLRYRYSYEYSLSNITVYGVNSNEQLSTYKYADSIIGTDRTLRYFFLAGDEADYSGMAGAYRDYLSVAGLLNQAIGPDDAIPLGIEMFMGTSEESMLQEIFISMTTFSEAEQICNHLRAAGADTLEVTLRGWTKGGYGEYPVVWPAERQIGGRKGLEAFAAYTNGAGITAFLRQNFVHANSDNKVFSTRRDTVQQGSGMPITDGRGFFLINTEVATDKAAAFLANTHQYCSDEDNQFGVAYDAIGSLVFHDFTRRGLASRSNTIQAWIGLLTADENRPAAVGGGNLYTLAYADRLYDVAEETEKYWCSDQEIPLYQMVVHGLIPYSTNSGNLSDNYTTQKLKWVEYGSMPFFELTYNQAVKLMETQANDLFSSYYLDWADIAADTYAEFNERLASVWSQTIVEHEIISGTLRKVRYGNGTVIYINYADTAAQADGYDLPARDYIVIDGE